VNEIPKDNTAIEDLDPAFINRTLFEAMLDARDRRGGKFEFIEDAEREPMTFDRLVLGASVLSGKIAAMSAPKERVGLLLPNSNGAAAVFFACHAAGRVPAMLNFSSGNRNLISCCQTAQIKTVFTSRRFVALGKLEDLIEALEKEVKIVWLEDVRKSITSLEKISGLIRSKFPRRMLAKLDTVPTDPAVVLFTSGTEGIPKGVVLSHRNMLANVSQIMATGALHEDDRVFNALPMFHSFGMTAAFILPVVTGMKVFMYPSPLHYKQIPPLVRDFGATVLFGTDTFAVGWGKVAEPEDFATIRFIVLGAERVRNTTRDMWREKFGIELYEGYGATEASPVLACNIPGAAKDGSVGKLFVGIKHRIDPVPALKDGGRLVVHGPNVMAGYMTHDKPGELQPPKDGWHDTGDIVEIDGDGFVLIKGRAKRFAKLGGEMVSLIAVENHVAAVWPDNVHAVAAIADKRKGEQLVLVTDRVKADRSELQKWAKANGVPELHLPKKILFVDELPVLGTGKMDYLAIQTLAES
jgi:acyl-[acyl-carrier-protein]-phospholipid O-acyltransferase / long-chain-fatty-acid--[acyl-carrier-protein] ligase